MYSKIKKIKITSNFFKFYPLGFLISLAIVLVVHIYGFFIDSIYSYHNFLESFTVVVLFSFPMAIHLWIMEHLMRSKTYANPNHQLLFKIVASYWLGYIISFMLLSFFLLINYFVTLSLINFITEDRLMLLSLLVGVPVSMLYFVYGFENWYDEKRKDK
jgi:hypothetical protein